MFVSFNLCHFLSIICIKLLRPLATRKDFELDSLLTLTLYSVLDSIRSTYDFCHLQLLFLCYFHSLPCLNQCIFSTLIPTTQTYTVFDSEPGFWNGVLLWRPLFHSLSSAFYFSCASHRFLPLFIEAELYTTQHLATTAIKYAILLVTSNSTSL